MPSRVWSHICEYAAVDASGKATIIGEFDSIHTQGVPLKFPLLFAVVKWNGNDKETFTHQVRITSPSGKQVAISGLTNVAIKGNVQGIGNHTNVDGFMMIDLLELGEYAIEILLNGDPVHIMPLTIVQR